MINYPKATIAIIGGSGLYEMEGLTGAEQVNVDTPNGNPSAAGAKEQRFYGLFENNSNRLA